MTFRLRDFFGRRYVSYRRLLVDTLLARRSGAVSGLVIDVGGKKENRRGAFGGFAASRSYSVNVDWVTRPHVIGDAHHLPIRSAVVDGVVCCEVLEHLESPETCCVEMQRITKPGGHLFITVPFMYPVHADPYDFSRFTEHRMRRCLGDCAVVDIEPMGGWLGTVGMLIEFGALKLPSTIGGRVVRRIVRVLGRAVAFVDDKVPAAWNSRAISTGYFCDCRK